MRFLYGSILVGLLSACSHESPMKSVQWSQYDKSPPPQISEDIKFGMTEANIQVGSEFVTRSPQVFEGAIVDGSFLQSIKTAKGKLLFMNGRFSEQNLNKLREEIKKQNQDKFNLLNIVRRKEPRFAASQKYWGPDLYVGDLGIHKTYWRLSYLDPAGHGAIELTYSNEGRILKRRLVSHNFEAQATVFPFGPKLSKLTKVPLANLIGDGTLTSMVVKSRNDGTSQAVNPEGDFSYDPGDDRFNQVQAFFYIDAFLNRMSEKFDLRLPFQVDVKVNALLDGKPSNRFYYYKGSVLLGQGDGVSYSRIPQDASIVTHEIVHPIVEALAHLPSDGEGGSINEGFADYLAASYLDNPKMGEVAYIKGPYKRNLSIQKTLSEKNGGLYNDSLIVSSLFWSIRTAIGADKSDLLALRTLARLAPDSKLESLGAALIDASKETSQEDQELVHQMLTKSGF